MSEYYKDTHRYDDILYLPHPTSKKHMPMSLHDRAAQFAPFAALTGHEEAIEETARLTEKEMILDETEIEKIDQRLRELEGRLSEQITVSIIYFRADVRKSGGAYLTDIGYIKKIDRDRHVVLMDSGNRIAMKDIKEIHIGGQEG